MIYFFWKHCFIVILHEWVKAWLLTKVDASELCSTRPQANEDLLVPDFPLGERFLASLLTYILHNLASIRKNTHTKPTNSNEVWCKKKLKVEITRLRDSSLKPSSDMLDSLCPNCYEHLSRASQPSISAILKNAQQCSTMFKMLWNTQVH